MAVTVPDNNAVPFAVSGSKNTIPVTPPGGGLASMTQGFPPVTMQPIASGGVPPAGQDFNGILNQLSSHQVFLNAGMLYKFDADFAADIGGYSKGAVLLLDDGLSSVQSTVDNNEIDPNSSMTGWQPYGGKLVNDAIAGISAGVVNLIYPVGSIVEFNNTVNPNTQFAGTTWVPFGEGRVTVGLSDEVSDPTWTKTIGNTHGVFEHTLTIDEIPPIEIDITLGSSDVGNTLPDQGQAGGSDTIYNPPSVGGGDPHENVQPSIVVARWVRMA